MKLCELNELPDSKIRSFILKLVDQGYRVDSLSGGLGDEVKLGEAIDEYSMDALIDGINVELEHTDNLSAALEIAIDHLKEDKDYYSKLKLIEPHH